MNKNGNISHPGTDVILMSHPGNLVHECESGLNGVGDQMLSSIIQSQYIKDYTVSINLIEQHRLMIAR